jgi:2-hydroxy-3-keto-5-methylthiopentenyl-1-phosphate phosphatase
MRETAGGGRAIVFVGDGLSDRHAVAAADLVYAKDKLAGYCAARDIPHVPFGGLSDVAADLTKRLRGGEVSRRRTAARVTA